MSSDPLLKMAHVREAKICAAGARAWFKQHDLNWPEFLRHGLPVSVIEGTGCNLCLRATSIARRESTDG